MPNLPYIMLEPLGVHTPLVVDSPHSGCVYPDDFDFECSLTMLQMTEDSYVDELVGNCIQAGAIFIAAEFPRCFIDVNRAEDDIDPALLSDKWPTALNPSDRTLLGLGLVRRLCKSGVPVYRRRLRSNEVMQRIVRYYRPYHDAVQRAVARRMAQFGECYLVDCHSMPGQGSEFSLSRRPDMVLGDRNGESSDPSFTRRACGLLQDMGYNVALNDPYKGMEVVRRYGNPKAGQHALQLEINRQLYMNEKTLEKHDGFARLQADLAVFFKGLAAELVRDLPDREAAE